jgi:hypothetical protein
MGGYEVKTEEKKEKGTKKERAMKLRKKKQN